MPDKEKLMKILRERYGITSVTELDDAIREQRQIDISVFVQGYKEKAD